MISKEKVVRVLSYDLVDNDFKFRIKVDKEFELWENGFKFGGLCGNRKRSIFLREDNLGMVLDGDDNFILWESIDSIVKKGEEVGLWEVDKKFGRRLNVIDKNGENWKKFWEIIVW